MSEALRQSKDKAAQLFAGGRLEAALAEYQHAVELAPDDLALQQKVAEVLQRLGRKQEAIESYEAVAVGWARQGLPLRAIALCKVILQIDSGHARTQRMLADLYARRQGPQPRLAPALAPVELPGEAEEAGGLPRVPLLSQLGQEAFLAILESLETRSLQPGDAIVTEGEPGDALYAVVDGRVAVVRQLEGGQRRTVTTLGPGEFFGEMALLSESRRLASVVAVEATVVLELTRAQVERLVQHHPSVGQVLQAFYQERLLANVLRSNPLFSALTPLQREAMVRALQVTSLPAGQTLLTQGQPVEALYLLLRGRCRVAQHNPGGREQEVSLLREGDVFGELAMLMGLVATASVSTETPCTLLRLERRAFELHILSQPGVREALTRLSAERLQRTARLLSGGVLHEGDQRV